MDGDLVAVEVLDYVDVPGYGSFKRGDVAGFEKSVAEPLIQQRRVRRFQVPPTTPAPSANTPPEQAPKLLGAEPTTLTPLPKPVPAVAASSPRAQEATATAYLERALFEPRPWNPAPWAKTVPVVTASSPRLAAAVAFLRDVLARRPRPVTEVLTLARESGISRATLRRAKRALAVKSQKVGMRAGWVWMIREETLSG